MAKQTAKKTATKKVVAKKAVTKPVAKKTTAKKTTVKKVATAPVVETLPCGCDKNCACAGKCHEHGHCKCHHGGFWKKLILEYKNRTWVKHIAEIMMLKKHLMKSQITFIKCMKCFGATI